MPNRRNRNRSGVPALVAQCPICMNPVRPNRLSNHMAMVHPTNPLRVTRRRRNNKNGRRLLSRQILQPANNLPVPGVPRPFLGQRTIGKSRRTYGNSSVGPRGKLTAQIDTAIDRNFTPDGAAFIHRACHPNDESRGGGVFIPDDTTADRAVLEERPYGVIQAPNTGADAPNWDCEMVVLPCPDTPYIFRTRAVGDEEWSTWKLGGSSAFVTPGTLRPALQVDASATDVLPAQQALSIKSPSLLHDTTQFRQAFSGLTVVMNSSSLHDEGYVTAGQWGNEGKVVLEVPRTSTFTNTNFPLGFDDPRYEPSKIECLLYEQVPSEVTDIVAACPEFGQWEAKKGIYMPMRFAQPTHQFNGGAISELRTRSLPDSTLLAQCGFPIILSEIAHPSILNGPNFLVQNLDEIAPENSVFLTSAGQVNQTFGAIIFSGLHHTTQLICKMRTGLDIVPAPTSPFAAFGQKGPVKDQLAIDMATSIQARLPLVYEHKYNVLGWLAGLVGKAAKILLPSFAPWLGEQVSKGATWLGEKIFGNGVPSV